MLSYAPDAFIGNKDTKSSIGSCWVVGGCLWMAEAISARKGFCPIVVV